MDAWVEHELDGSLFPDQRLKTRLGKLVTDLGQRIGDTIPMACQDWAATKTRFDATAGPVLVLHDTTEFSFTRNTPDGVGYLSYVKGRHATHPAGGVLMHSSPVLTTAGLPLGLAAVKFWTRKKFKGANALKRRVNPTRIPIEKEESVRWLENLKRATQLLGDPARCVHIGDREGDIYELFCAAEQAKTHFLVRTCVDRFAGQGNTTIAKAMARQPIQGQHEVEVRGAHGQVSTARVYLRFCRMTVYPPVAKRKRYPTLALTVIHAHERGTPKGRDPIRWELLTDLPVEDLAAAIEKLDWYAMRWKLEMHQADCPSSWGWVCPRRVGYQRRDGVARTGRVVPATSRQPRRSRSMSDTHRHAAPPRA